MEAGSLRYRRKNGESIMTFVYWVVLIAFIMAVIYLTRSSIIQYREQYILTKASEKISDGYLIFASNGKITNYNNAILDSFGFTKKDMKYKNVYELFNRETFANDDLKKIVDACQKIKDSKDTIRFEIKNKNDNKIYKIEIKSIVNNDIFLRYVMIFKDVTNTYEIIEELHSNQDLMANREKFATLGQLISGIVHSLKSPIFALSGELEGLNNLIKEYKESVGDETVTNEDHFAIAKDMNDVLDKMKEQVESISDSITAVRSQVVTINNEDQKKSFTVNELIKYIDLLMKNTLKECLIVLQFTARVSRDFEIQGNLNALVQAVNNLIMNSIESYHGKTNQTIEILIEKLDNSLAISVIDTGCGIPKRIQDKIFKEIITKEYSEKVGLGLFMAYSNIKAEFNGDIRFKSVEKKGSTFTILLPL